MLLLWRCVASRYVREEPLNLGIYFGPEAPTNFTEFQSLRLQERHGGPGYRRCTAGGKTIAGAFAVGQGSVKACYEIVANCEGQ